MKSKKTLTETLTDVHLGNISEKDAWKHILNLFLSTFPTLHELSEAFPIKSDDGLVTDETYNQNFNNFHKISGGQYVISVIKHNLNKIA